MGILWCRRRSGTVAIPVLTVLRTQFDSVFRPSTHGLGQFVLHVQYGGNAEASWDGNTGEGLHPVTGAKRPTEQVKPLKNARLPRSVGADEHREPLQIDRHVPQALEVVDLDRLNHGESPFAFSLPRAAVFSAFVR
jgi:hypothetical protein